MPTNITDVDTFTDPIQVPVDTEPADQAAFALAPQGLANRTRNLKNVTDDHETRIDDLETDVGNIDSANHTWSGTNTFSTNPQLGGSTELVYSSARARSKVIPLSAAFIRDVGNALLNDGANTLYGIIGAANMLLSNEVVTFPLNQFLPRAGTITGFNIMWTPGAAASMNAKLYKKTLNFSIVTPSSTVSASLSTVTSSGTALSVEAGAPSQAFDTGSEEWFIDVAGTNASDLLHGLRILYTETVATGG